MDKIAAKTVIYQNRTRLLTEEAFIILRVSKQ